jgi:hypothetical protein
MAPEESKYKSKLFQKKNTATKYFSLNYHGVKIKQSVALSSLSLSNRGLLMLATEYSQ